MSEICNKKCGLFSVVLQFFHFLCFFIFLFPYFLNLVSFFGPLFISTLVLFFVFSSLFLSSNLQFSHDSKMGFLATIYQIVFRSLRLRTRDGVGEFRSDDEVEAYKFVFGSCSFGSEQNPYGGGEDFEFNLTEVEVKVDCEGESVVNFPGKILDVEVDWKESMKNFPEKIVEMKVHCKESMEYFPGTILEKKVACEESVMNFPGKILDVKVDCTESIENFPWKILDMGVDCNEFIEYFPEKIMETKVGCEESVEYFPGKILDVEIDCEEHQENPLLNENVSETEPKTEELKAKIEKMEEINDSWNAIESKIIKDLKKLREESSMMRPRNSLGRTLASQQFEDRDDSEGSEGMDLLWETYEKIESKKLQRVNGRSKRGIRNDEDEDENGEGKLCCLRALKLSASRKMKLGIGKPNFSKMSKALKGFGLFRKRSLVR